MIYHLYQKIKPSYLILVVFLVYLTLFVPFYVHLKNVNQEHLNLKKEVLSLRNSHEKLLTENQSNTSFEKTLKQKVDNSLANILGSDNFSTTIIAEDASSPIAFHLTVDKLALSKTKHIQTLSEDYRETYLTSFRNDIENEVSYILQTYPSAKKTFNYVDFQENDPEIQTEPNFLMQASALSLGGLLVTVFIFYLIIKKTSKPSNKTNEKTHSSQTPLEEKNEQPISVIEILNKAPIYILARFLATEPMRPVALILSQMEAQRAAALIQEWPLEKQSELFTIFNKLDSEGIENLLDLTMKTLDINHSLNKNRTLTNVAKQIYMHLNQSTQEALSMHIHHLSLEVPSLS